MGFPIAQVSKQEMQRSRRANKASMGLNKLEKVRDSQAVQWLANQHIFETLKLLDTNHDPNESCRLLWVWSVFSILKVNLALQELEADRVAKGLACVHL